MPACHIKQQCCQHKKPQLGAANNAVAVQIVSGERLIINNGAAGMANFGGRTHGVITRISVDPTPPQDSLYGATIAGVRFDALPGHFDASAWIDHFARVWPEGTPAHYSYFDRIKHGPNYVLAQAVSGNVSLASATTRAPIQGTVEASTEALTALSA